MTSQLFDAEQVVRRPRLLDLFCGAGGCSVGYHRAGFDVIGVDIAPQPHYPYQFHQADALEYLQHHAHKFEVIHASPPCQHYSAMSASRPGLSQDYPDLIAPTRQLLQATGLPYIIENIPGSPLTQSSDLFGSHGILLCGRMFGLALYRHRLFETSTPHPQPHHPLHLTPASKAGHWTPGTVISVAGNCSPIALARTAMGIDWMTRDELAESIPPAYTHYLGEQLLTHLKAP